MKDVTVTDQVRAVLTDTAQTAAEISNLTGIKIQAVNACLHSMLSRTEVEKVYINGFNVAWKKLSPQPEDPNLYFNDFIRRRLHGCRV